MNNNIVLISGKSATGKSMAFRNLKDPEGVMYLDCENNKGLPFKSKFRQYTITDPYKIFEAMSVAETLPEVHTIIIDSLTFMMDMFETCYIDDAANGLQAWGEYAKFFKKLMNQYVAMSTKNIIFTAHTSDIMNDKEMALETKVQVKGSLMKKGIESYFNTVVSTKKMTIAKLKDYESDLLTITPAEEALGYKHCFQVNLTKETVNEAIRSAWGMWETEETYIDNDAQLVLDRIHEYHEEDKAA